LESVKREESEWGNRGLEGVAARRVREDCKTVTMGESVKVEQSFGVETSGGVLRARKDH